MNSTAWWELLSVRACSSHTMSKYHFIHDWFLYISLESLLSSLIQISLMSHLFWYHECVNVVFENSYTQINNLFQFTHIILFEMAAHSSF